jgi:hypothetical protein
MPPAKRISKTQESVNISATDIDFIKSTLTSMNAKLQEMELTLDKLNNTVVGDKAYGQIGLVEQVANHEKYIETDRHFKSKVVGGTIVVGFLWTLLLKFSDKLFN